METVSNLNKDTLDGLQRLIEINIDSAKGFTEAAEHVKNSDIATYFRRCAVRRGQFAGELQRVVGMNPGEKPETDGTVGGAIHRWWTSVRGTIQDGDEHAMLAEAERGEDAIKDRYEEVIKKTTGNPVNDVLHRQYASVKETHDHIRSLRDAAA